MESKHIFGWVGIGFGIVKLVRLFYGVVVHGKASVLESFGLLSFNILFIELETLEIDISTFYKLGLLVLKVDFVLAGTLVVSGEGIINRSSGKRI